MYETAKYKYLDMKKGLYWEYAKTLKKLRKPNSGSRGITNLFEADKLIEKQCGDFVGMAQSLIADPGQLTKLSMTKQKKLSMHAHIKIEHVSVDI